MLDTTHEIHRAPIITDNIIFSINFNINMRINKNLICLPKHMRLLFGGIAFMKRNPMIQKYVPLNVNLGKALNF